MFKDNVEVSKILSLVLRHQPEKIGISLDQEGWVDVSVLLAELNAHGNPLNIEELQEIVRTSDKKRFTFSEDGRKIRAAQGHSIQTVCVQYPELAPPDILYHGTAERFLAQIQKDGLLPGKRQHVHLTASKGIALETGKRHGKALLLQINAKAMDEAGFKFWLAENNVWLTEAVPSQFVTVSQAQELRYNLHE